MKYVALLLPLVSRLQDGEEQPVEAVAGLHHVGYEPRAVLPQHRHVYAGSLHVAPEVVVRPVRAARDLDPSPGLEQHLVVVGLGRVVGPLVGEVRPEPLLLRGHA